MVCFGVSFSAEPGLANQEGRSGSGRLHKLFAAEAMELEGSFGGRGMEKRPDVISGITNVRLLYAVCRCQQCWPAGRQDLESRGREVSRRSSDKTTGDGARILL